MPAPLPPGQVLDLVGFLNVELAPAIDQNCRSTSPPVDLKMAGEVEAPDQRQPLPQFFVLGATGYLGEGVCRAARASGYRVTAFIRSEDFNTKRHFHLAMEDVDIFTYDGSISQISADIAFTQAGSPDKCVVVDAIGAEAVSSIFFDLIREKVPQALFIALSTLLVYSESPGNIISEAHPVEADGGLGWRLKLDQEIIDAGGVVVRPAWAFGRSGGRYSWLQFAEDLSVVCRGTPTKRHSWVHVDDIGSAVVALANNASGARGRIFNVADDTVFPSRMEMVCALSDAVGAERTAVKWVPVHEPPAEEQKVRARRGGSFSRPASIMLSSEVRF